MTNEITQNDLDRLVIMTAKAGRLRFIFAEQYGTIERLCKSNDNLKLEKEAWTLFRDALDGLTKTHGALSDLRALVMGNSDIGRLQNSEELDRLFDTSQ